MMLGNSNRGWFTSKDSDVGSEYMEAIKWAQTDSPARYMCDSFCKYCDKSTEYCPNTADSPIASGEPGDCTCHCRTGSLAADFDRCTTVTRAICETTYCGGNGEGIFREGVFIRGGTERLSFFSP